jgi:hypothetical protein
VRLRYKIVVAAFFSLLLPLVVYSLGIYLRVFEYALKISIYMAHIIIPFFFFLVLFREDSLMKGFSPRIVSRRTVLACFTWTVAVGLEPQYSDFISVAILPALAADLFGITALPPHIPRMGSVIPAYQPMYLGFMLCYNIMFLTLAIFLSHCGKSSDNANS